MAKTTVRMTHAAAAQVQDMRIEQLERDVEFHTLEKRLLARLQDVTVERGVREATRGDQRVAETCLFAAIRYELRAGDASTRLGTAKSKLAAVKAERGY